MRNRRERIYTNDESCKNCILCCIPALILTELFYRMCSCFSTTSTKINIKKSK